MENEVTAMQYMANKEKQAEFFAEKLRLILIEHGFNHELVAGKAYKFEVDFCIGNDGLPYIDMASPTISWRTSYDA